MAKILVKQSGDDLHKDAFEVMPLTEVLPEPVVFQPFQGVGSPESSADVTGNHIFRQAAAPTASEGARNGDLWFDTDDNNHEYKLINGTWTSVRDTLAVSPSTLGWTQDFTWTKTDHNTLSWSSGTITTSDGTTYSIDAGNTGDISATTYIYLDTDTSITVLQTTTTASSAVGKNKILVAVAKNNADSGKKIKFQAFGGDGQGTFVTADEIAADTITANEIAANTITVAEIAAGTITTAEINVGSYFQMPSDVNLTGYWAFDEGSGTTVLDGTNSGNDGTISTGSYVSGASGTAVDLNGTSGKITIPDNAAFQNIFDSGGTFSCFINADDAGEQNEGMIFSKSVSNVSIQLELRLTDPSGGASKLRFQQSFSGTVGIWVTDDRVITDNTTHHVAVVYDNDAVGNDPTIYVDGVAVDITESSTPVGTRSTDVGNDLLFGNNQQDSQTFDGWIDEVRLYTATLTASEVQSLYFNPTGTQGTRIDGGQIRTASIVAGKLSVSQLSAIAADLGTVTAGTVQTDILIVGTTAGTIEERTNLVYNDYVFTGGPDDGMTANASSGGTITRGLVVTELEIADVGHQVRLESGDIGGPTGGTNNVDWDNNIEMVGIAEFDATTTQDAIIGLHDDAVQVPQNATETTRHAAFLVQDGTLKASIADGTTQETSTITATLTNKNTYRIVFTAATDVKFYLNGTLEATLSTNVPSGGTNPPSLKFGLRDDGSGATRHLTVTNAYIVGVEDIG